MKKEMWNGGKTNITTKEAKIFRQMEDGYDLDDSEIEFREELVKREELMREEAKKQQIESKYRLTRNQINKNMDEPCRISGEEPRNRYRRPEGDKVMTK